jgi:hypothetical protein
VSAHGETTRGLVVRRARVQASVVLAAFFLVLCATTALVTVAAFASATQARAVAATAKNATAAQRRIIVQTGGVSDAGQLDTAARLDATSTLTVLPSTTVTGLLGAPRAVHGENLLPVVWNSPEVKTAATPTQGRWPAAYSGGPELFGVAPPPLELAVSAEEAARDHLEIGQSITLGPGTSQFGRPPVPDVGTVVGIYRPKAADDPVWAIADAAGAGTEPLYVDQNAFGPRENVGGDVVVTQIDLSKLTAANLSAAQAQVHAVGVALAGDATVGLVGTETSVSTDAATLLDSTARALAAARPGIAIPAVEAIAVACCAIAVTARLLARDRRAHAALMRSRGASIWHLGRYDLIEALAVTVPAAAIAPFPAVYLASLLPPRDTGHSAGLSGTLWIAAGAAALVFVLVLLLSGSITARDDSVARVGRIPVGVTAAGIDLAALALAGAGIWELRSASARQASAGTLDPLTVGAPTLAVLAFALASVRLVTIVGRVAQAVGRRTRGWSGAFGSWHAARLLRGHTAAVVLIGAATALVVIGGAERIAADRSARDQADYAVGADVRATGSGIQPLRTSGEAATLPGVTGVAQVTRLDSTIGRSGTGGRATLLGVDPSAWQNVAVLRSDLAPGGIAGLTAPLRAHSVAEPGIVLPGKPHSLELTVKLARAPVAVVAGARVDVTLSGAFGEPETLSAPLAATAGSQRVTVDLTPAIGDGAQVAWPLRVTRIGVDMPTPSAGTATTTFDLLSATADTAPLKVAAGQSWSAVATVDVTTVPGTQYDLSNVRNGGSAQGTVSGSALLHGTFDPGTVPPSVGLPGESSFSAGAQVPAPMAVPAVATSQFLAASGAHVGSTVDVTANDGDLLLKIVGEEPTIPTSKPGDNAVLLDQGALDAYTTAHTLALAGGGEFWLSTQPGHAPQTAAKLLSTGLATAAQDRFSTAADLIDDPVRSGPLGSLTIAAWAAVLFALLGYGAHVASLLRERVPQLAAIHALGVGATRIGAAFAVEQALVVLVGVLAGGAVGLLLSELVVPATVLARDGQAPIPFVLVDLDWTAVGWSAVAVTAVIAAAGAWAAFLVPRLHMASLLRAGDAG